MQLIKFVGDAYLIRPNQVKFLPIKYALVSKYKHSVQNYMLHVKKKKSNN